MMISPALMCYFFLLVLCFNFAISSFPGEETESANIPDRRSSLYGLTGKRTAVKEFD